MKIRYCKKCGHEIVGKPPSHITIDEKGRVHRVKKCQCGCETAEVDEWVEVI